MTISDFLQKYKIVMHPIFWPIYIFSSYCPFFYIWAPAPEELSACPWCAVAGSECELRVEGGEAGQYRVSDSKMGCRRYFFPISPKVLLVPLLNVFFRASILLPALVSSDFLCPQRKVTGKPSLQAWLKTECVWLKQKKIFLRLDFLLSEFNITAYLFIIIFFYYTIVF